MSRVCSIFSQILQLAPRLEFEAAVRTHKAERHARGFSSWTQYTSMLFCQLGHAQTLREITGGLAACEGKLRHLGVEEPPKRPTLSYANEPRPWELCQTVFANLLERCQNEAAGKKRKFRFRHPLLSLDSTAIPLTLSVFDWAHYKTSTRKSLRNLKRREPAVDLQDARTGRVIGVHDPEVLAKAAESGRVPISHDRQTMVAHCVRFIESRSSPGLVIVPQDLDIGSAIDDLLVIWAASESEEWQESSALTLSTRREYKQPSVMLLDRGADVDARATGDEARVGGQVAISMRQHSSAIGGWR